MWRKVKSAVSTNKIGIGMLLDSPGNEIYTLNSHQWAGWAQDEQALFIACHLLFIRSVESIFMSVLDHADVIYTRASASSPKPHDAIHHSAFILSLEMPIQALLYSVQRGWTALPAQRPNFNMFLSISFKALIGKLPNCISLWIVQPTSTYIARSSDWLQLKNPQIHAFCARLTSLNKGSGRMNNLFQTDGYQSVDGLTARLKLSAIVSPTLLRYHDWLKGTNERRSAAHLFCWN